MLPVAHFELLP